MVGVLLGVGQRRAFDGARRSRRCCRRWTGGMMPKSLRAVARFFQETIGWNRIGLILSIAIISIAAVVLFHMLRDINTDEVITALKAADTHYIAAAAFFVACGYFTLTFYDWFALRTIGRSEVPYRIAALTGFTSYSIGHNIGAT